MIEKKSWDEFQSTGLFWFINSVLHLFGWSIVYETDENNSIVNVYPARCKYRGFSEDVQTEGFKNVTKYLKENISELEKETNE